MLLPAPLVPTTATVWPASIRQSTPWRTRVSGASTKANVTSATTMSPSGTRSVVTSASSSRCASCWLAYSVTRWVSGLRAKRTPASVPSRRTELGRMRLPAATNTPSTTSAPSVPFAVTTVRASRPMPRTKTISSRYFGSSPSRVELARARAPEVRAMTKSPTNSSCARRSLTSLAAPIDWREIFEARRLASAAAALAASTRGRIQRCTTSPAAPKYTSAASATTGEMKSREAKTSVIVMISVRAPSAAVKPPV